MVLSRDLERTLRLLQGYIDKLETWGYPSAVVYSTRQGCLKMHGSSSIKGVIKKHVQEIYTAMQNPANSDHQPTPSASGDLTEENEVSQADPEEDTLMLQPLTTRLESNTFVKNRDIAIRCTKVSLGGTKGRILWGKAESKPRWWPEHVPWTSRGLQMGVNSGHLHDVIRACYEHHKQPLYAVSIFPRLSF